MKKDSVQSGKETKKAGIMDLVKNLIVPRWSLKYKSPKTNSAGSLVNS